jgi:DNA-binding XRE family transcriptional regulator
MAETPLPTNAHGVAAPDRPEPSHEADSGDREPLWRDALGGYLRDRRRDRGETLTDTASRAGISPQYLSEMERGVKDPSSEMIAAVAGALDLTLADLTHAVAERLHTGRVSAVACADRRAAYALAS